jgi:hypothetical protein
MEVEADGLQFEATISNKVIDTLRPADTSGNELPAVLKGWFDENAGQPPRTDRVRFRRDGSRFVMEPLTTSSNFGMRAWERYLREQIPPAFGLQFNPAIWNVGFVATDSDAFLLVTLFKDDMNTDHKYSDHFLSDQEFSWQSQNRTTQSSKHGQLIHDHRARGARVHLFVRATKKTGQKATPFTYCGEVDFVSWEGDRPITVRWRLREAVPSSLHATPKVPV